MTKERDIAEDRPFDGLLSQIKAAEDTQGYLGDQAVVVSLLRTLLSDATEEGADHHKLCQAFARDMLGEGGFTAVPGWNRPGGIDAFVARWVGAESTDPHERLEQAAVQFLVEALDIGEYAETAPDDDWKWQLGELVTSYARLLMGVPPTVEVEPDDEETLQEQLARLTEGWVTINTDAEVVDDGLDVTALAIRSVYGRKGGDAGSK